MCAFFYRFFYEIFSRTKTLAEGRRRFQKMTKKGSKNDVLAPPFWGYTGQNGQKRPFLTPGGGSHTPGGGSHTPKFGGGPPPRTRIGAFLDFLGCRCFLENVANTFAEFCTNISLTTSQRCFCERFVEDLSRDFTETLMTNWSMTRSTLREYFVEDFVEDFVQDLIGDRSTTHRLLCERFVEDTFDKNIWETPENKKFTRCVDEKISTRCVKFLRTQISNCSRRTQVSIRNRSPIGACDLKYDS